jgi:hypothetical protein
MWTVRSTKWTVISTMWTVRSTKWTVRSTMWTVRSTKCFFKSIIYISSINPCVLKYDIVSPLRGTISLKKGYLIVARDTSDTQLVLGAIRKLCQNVWRMVTFLAFCLWLLVEKYFDKGNKWVNNKSASRKYVVALKENCFSASFCPL